MIRGKTCGWMRGLMFGSLPAQIPGQMRGAIRGACSAQMRGLIPVRIDAKVAGYFCVTKGGMIAVRTGDGDSKPG